jgi:hypothetical protein
MSEAEAIEAQIRDLAAKRALLSPGHPVEPPRDPALVHHADNMLWHVRPAADATSAIELSLYHPGLGWISIKMSRAQIEDLQDSVTMALQDMPIIHNKATLGNTGATKGKTP